MDTLEIGIHDGATFLDLSKAFDWVSHNVLLGKLNIYGISGTALKFLETYLFQRKQYI